MKQPIHKGILKKIHRDVQDIILKSKATFFVTEPSIEIPSDEMLYELKAEISNNISTYFIKLIEDNKNGK